MSEMLFSLRDIKQEPARVKRSAKNLGTDTRAKIVTGALISLGILCFVWYSNREFEKKLTLFPQAKAVVEKTVFDRKENISLKFLLGQRNPWTENLLTLIDRKNVDAQSENISPTLRINDIKVTSEVIRQETGTKMEVPMNITKTGIDEVTVTADPSNNRLAPGKYNLTLTVQRGAISQTITQDFSWGVLAINTNKPEYIPGEEGFLSFAVLDDSGNMVCDANLDLEIKTPSGKTELASTTNGLITISDTCSKKSFVNQEDFYLSYKFEEAGTYKFNLKAVTYNGSYAINDSVNVTNDRPFDIERFTSTRIFPALRYPVLIKVIPRQDFEGSIHEKVPAQFDITNDSFDNYGAYFAVKGLKGDNISPNINFQTINEKKYKALQWNVSWKKGETYYLYYEYDSPDKSPNLFTLGPLKGVDTNKVIMLSEAREWQIAVDAVATTGWMAYADATLTPPAGGNPRIRKFTAPTTWAAEFTTSSGTTANRSLITWVKMDVAPTREENIIGSLKVDGDLVIHTCTTGCDAAADYTYRWDNPGTSTTQDCDNTSPHVPWKCIRPFDIEYESLKGRAMVVYSDNTMDRLYYALWNGTGWSPTATPGGPGTTNQIDLPGSAGYPGWVVLKAAKPNLAEVRSDNMMLLVADTNSGLFAFYWNGSSWNSGATIESTLAVDCGLGQCFDGDWSDNDTFTVFYDDRTNTDVNFQKFTVTSGTWSTENVAFATNTNAQWTQSVPDPTSTRISIALTESGNDTRNVLYRGDNSSETFTTCSATDCPDLTSEITDNQQSSFAFDRWAGDGMYAYNDDGTGNSAYYFSVSAPGTWAAKVLIGTTAADDHLRIAAYGHPNNDNIMYGIEDVDCDLNVRLWSGARLEGNVTDIETDISNYGITCPNATAPGNDPAGAGQAWDFKFSQYSAWSRNWHFYSDIANTDPSTGLGGAGENTAPSDVLNGTFMRLRINMAELTNASETDTRKVLQYTADCSPNTAENVCNWTDVGNTSDSSATWRYATTGETCAGCGDGATSATSRITGTNQTTPKVFFVASKDAAADTDFDHTALNVVEIDFPIYAQNVSAYTTYYFRIYEPSLNRVGMDSPVFREQDDDNSYDCNGTTYCTYPSLKTGAVQTTAQDPGLYIEGGDNSLNFDGVDLK